MLKNINGIFRPKGIFVFSHLRFNTVRAQSNDSGMENKKNSSSGAKIYWTLAHKELWSHMEFPH